MTDSRQMQAIRIEEVPEWLATDSRQMQVLGAFVHGWLSAFHLLGFAYNLQRGNRLDAIIHACGCAYDVHATIDHVLAARET